MSRDQDRLRTLIETMQQATIDSWQGNAPSEAQRESDFNEAVGLLANIVGQVLPEYWVVSVVLPSGDRAMVAGPYHSEEDARNFLPMPTHVNRGGVCIHHFSTGQEGSKIVAWWDLENDEWTQ